MRTNDLKWKIWIVVFSIFFGEELVVGNSVNELYYMVFELKWWCKKSSKSGLMKRI